MLQNEIDEISVAFLDAWDQYFGEKMFYVPFLEAETSVHRVYKESKTKTYDYANKLQFTGTFKQQPIREEGEIAGKEEIEQAEITFVTKELYDKGVLEIDARSIVEITHRNGKTATYNIHNYYGKVQLGNNRIFTKLAVTEIIK
jgi:hypothetical protein